MKTHLQTFVSRFTRPISAVCVLMLIALVLTYAAAFTVTVYAQGQGYLLPGSVAVCNPTQDNPAIDASCTTRDKPVLVMLESYDDTWMKVYSQSNVFAGYVRKTDVPDALNSAVPTETASAVRAPENTAPTYAMPNAVNLMNVNFGLVAANFGTLWGNGFWHGIIMLGLFICVLMFGPTENFIEDRTEVNIRYFAIWIYSFVLAWAEYMIGTGQATKVIAFFVGYIGSWFTGGAIWVVAIIGVLGYFWQWQAIWDQSGQITDVDTSKTPETKRFVDSDTREEWIKSKMKGEGYRLVRGSGGGAKQGYVRGEKEPYWVMVEKAKETSREDGSYGYCALLAPWIALELFCVLVFAVKTSFTGFDLWDLLLIPPLYLAAKEVWGEFGKSWGYIFSTLLYGIIIGGLIVAVKLLGFIIPEANFWSALRNLPWELALIAVPVTRVLSKPQKRFAEGDLDLAGLLAIIILIVMQMARVFGPSVSSFIYGG